MNDVAERAGVSPVTIYNYFDSKDELTRDVVKKLLLSLLEEYRATIKGNRPFLERLDIILFDKTEIASQYQGELLQSVIQSDLEVHQFIESIWQKEVNHLTVDFFDEGKKQGYIDSRLPQEAILVYFEILRKGIYASSNLLENMERNTKLVSDIVSLVHYGLRGKRE